MILEPIYSKNYDNEQLLDIQILYLRNVHNYCFYCALEYDNDRVLTSKCGNAHLRSNIVYENNDLTVRQVFILYHIIL